LGDSDPKLRGGLEVHHDVELIGQLDRQIARLGAFEELVDVAGRPLPGRARWAAALSHTALSAVEAG
jgi:hypothetical protein